MAARRLNGLLTEVVPHNRFYAEKLGLVRSRAGVARRPGAASRTRSRTSWSPRRTAANFAANLTYPLERYVRYHHTSGTRGRPLPVLDTAADWQWWIECWQFVLDAAEVGAGRPGVAGLFVRPVHRLLERPRRGGRPRGMVIPSGGMNTLARLELLRRTRATLLFCTPSYALRLAEVAHENRIDPASLDVRRIIVAGEPGGSVPACGGESSRSGTPG